MMTTEEKIEHLDWWENQRFSHPRIGRFHTTGIWYAEIVDNGRHFTGNGESMIDAIYSCRVEFTRDPDIDSIVRNDDMSIDEIDARLSNSDKDEVLRLSLSAPLIPPVAFLRTRLPVSLKSAVDYCRAVRPVR